MARQNKELGRFQLTGIRRAMRGVPQIEVTFSIDANGIVNVSAKDLATGKAQQITITATSNMSQAEIDRAVRDAQQYAAEDAKLREEATVRDRCEQLLYRAGGLDRGAPREDKARVADAVRAVRRALRSRDPAAMTQSADALEAILTGLHVADAPYRAASAETQSPEASSDDAMDAEFEPLDDN